MNAFVTAAETEPVPLPGKGRPNEELSCVLRQWATVPRPLAGETPDPRHHTQKLSRGGSIGLMAFEGSAAARLLAAARDTGDSVFVVVGWEFEETGIGDRLQVECKVNRVSVELGILTAVLAFSGSPRRVPTSAAPIV